MDRSHLIEVNGLSFAYNSELVLKDVTFSINAGDMVALVGPNGGGKTTLLRLLLGLLRPRQGTVRIFGKPPAEVSPRLGYVPQRAVVDPDFPVNVLDVVLMGRIERRRCGPYGRQNRQQALTALEQVGLAELRARPFSELSGGERQRTLIAQALCSQPEILLLDEPTANVDFKVEQMIYDLLKELNKELTIVLVSHNMGIVTKHVRHVVCVNRTTCIHPTSALTGELISEVYSGEMVMVRHDVHCPATDHDGPHPPPCEEHPNVGGGW
ncbi:MAG: ABC transporter ATP-binding protein [Planctomycetes bacterium]|nr:ABC transporter ATP-binding protein [Planctomycetota bacterium]